MPEAPSTARTRRLDRPRIEPADAARIALVFALACLAAVVAAALTREGGRIATLWPANGIIVAAMLRAAPRMTRPLYWAGLLGIQTGMAILHDPVPTALFYNACNAFEIAAVVWAMSRLCPTAREDFTQSNNLPIFGLISLAAPIVPATLAAILSDFTGIGEGLDVVATWYCADLLGMVTIVPLVVTLRQAQIRELLEPGRRAEIIGLFSVLAIMLFYGLIQSEHQRLFQVFPVLIFIAFRLGFAGATLAVGFTAISAIVAIVVDVGPVNMIHGTAQEQIFVVQTFVALATLTSLQVAASLAERRRLMGALTLAMAKAADSETALIEARDRAEAGHRAKADFLANMSHELRTPLTAVIGLSETLLREGAEHTPEQVRRYHEMQRDAGETLLGLITDILDFERIEAGVVRVEHASFAPDDVVEQCREMIVPIASRRQVAVETDFAAAVPSWLIGDAFKIRQILTNLLANAVKFTPDGGEVTLTVSAEDDTVRYAVHDTGIGIAPEHLDHIFERFTQAENSTRRRYGGSGLGLTISKRLAEAMGDRLEVESTLGAGSTFSLVVPLEEDPENGVASAANDDAPIAAYAPRRLLLAEDNPINREILTGALEAAGHTVTMAENGAEAVAAFRAGRFDLVLMDVQMPGVDGYAATRQIRAIETGTGRRTPIVAVTANAVAQERDHCLAAGMDDHVTKPVAWPHLFAVIDRLTALRCAA